MITNIIKLQQMIRWYSGYLIKKLIITCFILNVYLENIDKNDRKLKYMAMPAIYSKLATKKPNPKGTCTGQN